MGSKVLAVTSSAEMLGSWPPSAGMVRVHSRRSVGSRSKHHIVDPLFAFAFIQTFVEILQDYFGTLSAATLRDNFDVVYQAGLPV